MSNEIISITQFFPGAPDKLYAWFVEPNKFARWFFPDACVVDEARLEGEVGGRFYVRMHDEADVELVAAGRVVAVEAPRLLRFTWAWQTHGFQKNETLVEVAIEAVKGGARLVIIHRQVVAEENAMHLAGWHSALAKLAGELNPAGE